MEKTGRELGANIVKALRHGRSVLWMLDYDGTLTPIVSDPTQAHLSPAHMAHLQALCIVPHLRVAIVSGRSVEQLQGFLSALSAEPLLLAGLHGGCVYDGTTQQWLSTPDPSWRALAQSFKQRLERGVAEAEWPGIHLEDKGEAITLHWRQAPEELVPQAQALFHLVYQTQEPDLSKNFRIQSGKAVLELVPHTFSKGQAVSVLVDHCKESAQAVYPVYLGDDLTDESAFEVVNRLGGLSVRVGAPSPETSPPSHAQWMLPSLQAVYDGMVYVLDEMIPDAHR
jgi:trehalose-phosphatase